MTIHKRRTVGVSISTGSGGSLSTHNIHMLPISECFLDYFLPDTSTNMPIVIPGYSEQ